MFDFALSNTGTLELLIREVSLDIERPSLNSRDFDA